jgi:hypothetical protein
MREIVVPRRRHQRKFHADAGGEMMLSAFYEKASADVALYREGREREVFNND